MRTKTQMTESFNQYSENETKIWRQNTLNQFSRVSSSCLHSHFVISLLPLQNPGGGALQLHLYGGVWPQDWKIDPSAD